MLAEYRPRPRRQMACPAGECDREVWRAATIAQVEARMADITRRLKDRRRLDPETLADLLLERWTLRQRVRDFNRCPPRCVELGTCADAAALNEAA